MQGYYKDSGGGNSQNVCLNLGMPCAVLYTDGEWYRARITGNISSITDALMLIHIYIYRVCFAI